MVNFISKLHRTRLMKSFDLREFTANRIKTSVTDRKASVQFFQHALSPSPRSLRLPKCIYVNQRKNNTTRKHIRMHTVRYHVGKQRILRVPEIPHRHTAQPAVYFSKYGHLRTFKPSKATLICKHFSSISIYKKISIGKNKEKCSISHLSLPALSINIHEKNYNETNSTVLCYCHLCRRKQY